MTDGTSVPCCGAPNRAVLELTVVAREVTGMFHGEMAKYRVDDRLREAEHERLANAVRRTRPARERRGERGRLSLRLRRLAYLVTASSV